MDDEKRNAIEKLLIDALAIIDESIENHAIDGIARMKRAREKLVKSLELIGAMNERGENGRGPPGKNKTGSMKLRDYIGMDNTMARKK